MQRGGVKTDASAGICVEMMHPEQTAYLKTFECASDLVTILV